MIIGDELELAIRLLSRYEEAWYPNPEAVSDIREGLYWDKENCCFSADIGSLLRGEAESVQIFRAIEWAYKPTTLEHPEDCRNQFDAVVVDKDSAIYFIRKVK